LICVTLNAPNDWSDHKKLLDFGFDNMKKKLCINEGDKSSEILVKNGTVPLIETKYSCDFNVYITDSEKVTIQHFVPKSIDAPVSKGDIVGFSKIYVDNNLVGEVNIVSLSNSDITNKNKLIQTFLSYIGSIM
jgi:D-alanyl-D-alanine carboxypeptidase